MESFESTTANPESPWRSKTVRRSAQIAATLLVLLALALTPPLLNVNRLQRRIAGSMSESLGRPVHLDSVTLHLLPMPGFTLQNLVVSEDAAFGAEPTIRANVVELTLRPSSLWRRQVEISRIHFVDGTSLNLVRNAEGRWNLEDLLMHASRVQTAPTVQATAGPAPRFPYIEATGARVNLKLQNEKMPFSLTEADFALWLPSPQGWRVRFEGKPARTDTSISDPGIVRLEGSLDRAATMAEVPVDLHASWHNAPLGEASKLLSGDDAGWRGTLTFDAALTGKLAAAEFSAKLTLNDLRRADFVPAKSLDLTVECVGQAAITAATLGDPQCMLQTPEGSTPEGKERGQITASADRFALTPPQVSGGHIGIANAPVTWILDWARLFSERIPVEETLAGTADGNLMLVPSTNGPSTLQGEVHAELPGLASQDTSLPTKDPTPMDVSITAVPQGLVLSPVDVSGTAKSPLLLSGNLAWSGYTVRLAGVAGAEEIAHLRSLMPALGDGLDQILPATTKDAAAPAKIDVTCTRAWGSRQTCVSNTHADAAIKPRPAKRR